VNIPYVNPLLLVFAQVIRLGFRICKKTRRAGH
jgi:hypothetical protein